MAKYIGEILIEEGLLTEDQLKEALGLQKKQVGQILLEKGYVKEEDLDKALQLQFGISRSERYARYLRMLLLVLLVLSCAFGVILYRLDRQAGFSERLSEGKLSFTEIRDVITGGGSAYKLDALRSLEHYTPGEREELLILALQSDSWYVRLYAALFVNKSANLHFISHLIPLTIHEEEPVVRFAAAEALKNITGKNLDASFQAWLNYAKERGIKVDIPARLKKTRNKSD